MKVREFHFNLMKSHGIFLFVNVYNKKMEWEVSTAPPDTTASLLIIYIGTQAITLDWW